MLLTLHFSKELRNNTIMSDSSEIETFGQADSFDGLRGKMLSNIGYEHIFDT